MKKSTNVAVHLISAAILLVDFLLCRYLFFDLHGRFSRKLTYFAYMSGGLKV